MVAVPLNLGGEEMPEPKFGEWQPIETAPMNPREHIWGPRILIWTTHHKQPMTIIGRYVAGKVNRWMDSDSNSSVSAIPGDGSYWMPLPPPPEEKE